MTGQVVKASRELKSSTATVRKMFDAHDRAREIYLQQIKRAEADYCERLRQAMTLITGQPEASEPIVNQDASSAPSPAG